MGTFDILGRSQIHIDLLDKLSRVACTDAEILISGPSGVGKELYARFAHEKSKRAAFPLISVNCGAIPSELLENELFGHRDGAYTSARDSHEGLVAEAENGTLFFDEIDALPPQGQVKLLRFIQLKEYRRLGDSRIRKANLRFIAATNAELPSLVEQGRFRGDLYYRLSVFPVFVPPLSQRRDDIALLLGEFATRCSDNYQLPRIVLSPRALQFLLDYDWPGNVRELENCVKYLTCLQLTRPVDKYDLPMRCAPASSGPNGADLLEKSFTAARMEFERRYVTEALRKANGNVTRAAEESGEYRKKMARLIKKHGLTTAVANSNSAVASDG
mgnify:CR=1 FL=1